MSKRIKELDSIRGLAALTVVFGHFCLMLPSLPNSIKFSPLRFYGRVGKLLSFLCTKWFCVIYGTLSFKTNYWGYLIKRFVRIYIPYYFWIIVTFVLFILFSSYEVVGLRDWFYDRWQGSITKLDILNHFVLLNNFLRKIIIQLFGHWLKKCVYLLCFLCYSFFL